MSENSGFLFDLKKLKKGDDASQISLEEKSFKQTQTKTIRPSIFLFMTKAQAKEQGTAVLDLFNKYNCVNSEDQMIDEEEYAMFQKGDISFDNTASLAKRLGNNTNKSTVKQKEKIEIVFNEIGQKEKIDKIITNLSSTTKVDLNTIAKSKYGINLSQFSTKKEQEDALVAAINNKYKVLDLSKIDLAVYNAEPEKTKALQSAISANCGENSVYAKHFKRISEGEFTETEIKKYNLNNVSLTSEQCARYAKIATEEEQTVDILDTFSSLNEDGRNNLVSHIDKFNPNTHTALIAGMMSMTDDPSESQKYAKSIMSQNVKISDKSYSTSELAFTELFMHSNFENAMTFVTDSSHFKNGSVQLAAFIASNHVEQEKVKSGKISQEQYNKNYSGSYAKNAHKLKNASKAYSYVSKNTNEENRQKTIETLASCAYQIRDEKERDNAVNLIKNSLYFSKDVEQKLKLSYEKFILEQAAEKKKNKEIELAKFDNNSLQKVSDSIDFEGNVIVNPALNNEEHNIYVKNTQKENNNIQISSIQSYIQQMKNLLEQAENTKITKELKTKQEQLSCVLENLYNIDVFKDSSYETDVLNLISSLQNDTIISIMINLNPNIQKHFIDKKVISIAEIDKIIIPSDRRLIAPTIQAMLDEYASNKSIK